MAKGKPAGKAKIAVPSDDKWRAESDHRTLREAEEIKGDKGRLGAAAAHAKEQMEANAKVAGLHKRGIISDKVLDRIKGFAQPPAAATPGAADTAAPQPPAAPNISQ